jgi:serine/threonine protein kinase
LGGGVEEMTIAEGTRLGPYEILSALGAGGMGEVYRARDTKLDRDVAIKILPELFAADPERIARFEREAKTLASLNHPHIGGIYGVEDANGVRALVLELVRDRRSPIGSRRGRFLSMRRYQSRGRSRRRSKRPTSKGSSTAISSPRTSSSGQTAR